MPNELSFAERLTQSLGDNWRQKIADWDDDFARRFEFDWRSWARDAQLAPSGRWHIWLVMAGRGFGKTRAGAEWIREQVRKNPGARFALVGATLGEVRQVMVEGESGLIAIAPPADRPTWHPSLRRLAWANGAQAFIYSAEEPDSLRGGQHSAAWADEIAKWPKGEETWDNLILSVRSGRWPRVVATTTPRPVPLIRRLVKQDGVIVTHGRTQDNRGNLPEVFLAEVARAYGGTRLGRQELGGELIEEMEGALWSRDLIEARRVRLVPEAARMVVAVDPPAGTGGDACGIVAAALGRDGFAYVIEDASVTGLGPEGWARAVAACAARHRADRVVAEANNGGAMVASVLRAAAANLPVRTVHASRGKVARAEPVAALYAAGRAFHVGAFPTLEDEMCGLLTGGGYAGPGRSPDRADALVWALTELMLGPQPGHVGVRLL
jgi:phage terminase large subunit-like protein